MENQHRQTSGFHVVMPEEVRLMNEIKAFGQALEQLCDKVRAHITAQYQKTHLGETEMDRLCRAQPENWESWGRSNFQSGLMYLKRAVQQPSEF
ncbi:hypothetical protein PWG14_25335 [Chromobacterium amazonense]|uniref:hypothetical protein n=1 Tax=Chromobacterium amazonense TaxID=1382803 RepID=UPI00237DFB41|nr:hypothetical protein [Chromobacterium amazonense]MDE1715795.1 hypothetical protein [Chromobacterium amazonense]